MTDARSYVVDWLQAQARPLADLGTGYDPVGQALVVGLGITCHGTHELNAAAQAVLRPLVERCGYRALGLEESPALGASIDSYVRTGEGDARALVGRLWPHHRNEDVLGLVEWVRAYDEAHPRDPIRVVGLEPTAEEADVGDPIAYVEPRLAENAARWCDETCDKLLYWGGVPHTAVGDARTVTWSGRPGATHRNAGSHLREHFGDDYVSIGLTFGQGAVELGDGPTPVPAPPPGFTEEAFDAAGPGPYLVDLHQPAPPPVRAWLDAPATLRLVGPHYEPAHHAGNHLTGASLAAWFDAFGYVRHVTPYHAFASAAHGSPGATA